LRQISEWLDTHPGGASLALSRALSLEIMAVVWMVLCVGMITAGGIVSNTGGSSVKVAGAMLIGVVAGLIAIANLAVAREYEEAVSKHPNGLPDWPLG
jgi:ABC-type nickel/cobalt efflux system permease component RcnA